MGARSPAAGAEAGSRDQRVELTARAEGISGQLWEAGARALSGGGAEGTRTPDPLRARQVLSQLSYSPVYLQSRRDDSRKWLDAQRKESLDRIECSRPLRGSPGSKRPPPPPLDQRGTLPSTQRPSPAPCERRALPQDERQQRAEVAKATGVRPTVATHGGWTPGRLGSSSPPEWTARGSKCYGGSHANPAGYPRLSDALQRWVRSLHPGPLSGAGRPPRGPRLHTAGRPVSSRLRYAGGAHP